MELFLLALKIVGILLGILLILFAVLLWCCCVVSGWNSRQDENDEELFKRDNRMTVLSDLEQQTFEKLKSELVEDFKYLFEVNKKNDVTVGECLDKFENGSYTILSNGKCIGFTL